MNRFALKASISLPPSSLYIVTLEPMPVTYFNISSLNIDNLLSDCNGIKDTPISSIYVNIAIGIGLIDSSSSNESIISE